MRRKGLLLVAGMAVLLLFSGCGEKEENKAEKVPVSAGKVKSDEPSELEVKYNKFKGASEKANKLYGNGDYENAETAFLEALEIAPNNTSALYNLSCTYALDGKTEEALKYLRKAVESGWWNNDHLDRDSDLDSIRDSDEFKEIYNLSSELLQAFMEKWHSVYSMENVKGKKFASLDEMDEYFKKQFGEMYNSGFMFSNAEFQEKQYALLNEKMASLKLMDWKNDPNIYLEVLKTLYSGNDGDKEEALKLYNTFISDFDGEPVAVAMYNYAKIVMENDEAEGQKTIAEIIKRFPNSKWSAMAYTDMAMDQYYNADNKDDAYKTYLKAVDMAGEDKEALAYIGSNLWFYEYNRVGLPEFTANDWDNKPLILDDYKGKVLMLDFWATWCGPCVREIPNVVKAYENYNSKGFEIVGISLDQNMTVEDLKAWCNERKMSWRQIYDGKGWQAALAGIFNIQSIPKMILIDREGKVHPAQRGEALVEQIKELVEK